MVFLSVTGPDWIRIRSGLNWVSGSGLGMRTQADKIVVQKRKKRRNFMFEEISVGWIRIQQQTGSGFSKIPGD
jgi:hypothetical protein